MLIIRSLIVLILASAAPAWALTLEGDAHVVDGDTLDVAGHAVRLFGIDAPELQQTCTRGGQAWACGHWAREELAQAVQGAAVSCTVQDRDKYGRSVAICTAAGRDLGQLLVEAGAAGAYRRYSDRYARAEAGAERRKLGIWSAVMQSPEAFRHAGADRAPAVVEGCAIKANISASGRIYHRPGQRDYAVTRINLARGEAFFCTESAARAAGFRPVRR
ncbi:thermonuclease family protein [Rhodobacter ferrooxidans]|uniref:Nuclease (SNase domain protein) n=1 Tax=Rhodobacter ferrooxidans TaxID=371731 RepID=C8S1G9_9RHOB|nr:thermonuclease family protein [Rhodobacter sp. SW2]EEW25142.1 nuclease (SNase domain protein) [Rhodobacter sp. SW2]